jgi:hypothetical protein
MGDRGYQQSGGCPEDKNEFLTEMSEKKWGKIIRAHDPPKNLRFWHCSWTIPVMITTLISTIPR